MNPPRANDRLIEIRPFTAGDAARLVRILISNDQYAHAAVEGPDAMVRASASPVTVFLVAAADDCPVGFVRAVYDGTRAMIHVLSIDPDYQRRGIGRSLVLAVREELRSRGAPTVSVTVTGGSAPFWEHLGFVTLPVTLMLKDPI